MGFFMAKSKERENVLAKALALGLEFAKNISTKRLKKLIESHNPEVPEVTEVPEVPEPTIPSPPKERVRHRRSPPCPECGAHPVVCRIRRPGYAAFRCRECGYHWETEGAGGSAGLRKSRM